MARVIRDHVTQRPSCPSRIIDPGCSFRGSRNGLFRRGRGWLPPHVVRPGAGLFLFDPETVMLLGPVNIYSAAAHRLEGSFHSDGSDIDVTQHRGYEEYGNNRVDDFSDLHAVNVRSIEREHQDIAADRHGTAAQHDDPVDRFLTCVEAERRRVVMPNHSTSAFEPINVYLVRNIAGDPHQKNEDDTE